MDAGQKEAERRIEGTLKVIERFSAIQSAVAAAIALGVIEGAAKASANVGGPDIAAPMILTAIGKALGNSALGMTDGWPGVNPGQAVDVVLAVVSHVAREEVIKATKGKG